MATKTSLTWLGGMTFEAEVNGHHFNLDTSQDKGGSDNGPRPKPLLLAALSGCSGMDTVSILDKMQIDNYKLRIEMEAEQTDEHPMTYHTIRMIYRFTGDNLPVNKVMHAIELSISKYCAVYAMLSKSAKIETKVMINEKEVFNA